MAPQLLQLLVQFKSLVKYTLFDFEYVINQLLVFLFEHFKSISKAHDAASLIRVCIKNADNFIPAV